MKILDRYIGRQLLTGSIIGVFVLSFLIVFVNVFRKLLPRLVEDDVPASYVFEFIALVLPFSLVFTIPWGFLTALLLLFGRLSADNELISMRMAGMSFTRICASVFVLALIFCGISLWINVSLAPKAQSAIRSGLYDLWTENPLSIFEPDTEIDKLSGLRIFIREKEGNVLRGFHMVQLEGNKPATVIRSPEVTVTVSDDGDWLILSMKDQELQPVQEPGEPTTMKPGIVVGDGTQRISLVEIKEKARQDRVSSRVTSVLKDQLASGVDPSTGDELSVGMRTSIRTEINKRRSFSLACITFAFLGIPLGITAQRRETSIGFVIGIFVAAIYFFLIIMAEMVREDPSAKPYLLMWLPNLVFLTLGLFMFWRLSRR